MPHQTTFLILLNLALYARKKPKVEWTFIDNYNIMFVLTCINQSRTIFLDCRGSCSKYSGNIAWLQLESHPGFERYVFFYPLELAL